MDGSGAWCMAHSCFLSRQSGHECVQQHRVRIMALTCGSDHLFGHKNTHSMFLVPNFQRQINKRMVEFSIAFLGRWFYRGHNERVWCMAYSCLGCNSEASTICKQPTGFDSRHAHAAIAKFFCLPFLPSLHFFRPSSFSCALNYTLHGFHFFFISGIRAAGG